MSVLLVHLTFVRWVMTPNAKAHCRWELSGMGSPVEKGNLNGERMGEKRRNVRFKKNLIIKIFWLVYLHLFFTFLSTSCPFRPPNCKLQQVVRWSCQVAVGALMNCACWTGLTCRVLSSLAGWWIWLGIRGPVRHNTLWFACFAPDPQQWRRLPGGDFLFGLERFDEVQRYQASDCFSAAWALDAVRGVHEGHLYPRWVFCFCRGFWIR